MDLYGLLKWSISFSDLSRIEFSYDSQHAGYQSGNTAYLTSMYLKACIYVATIFFVYKINKYSAT